MADRARQILKNLLNIWNKYTSKQKTLIISVTCIVIFAFALLIFLMQRTVYEKLVTADTVGDASKITELLKGQGIAYKVAGDKQTISVDENRLTDATFLLADNDMPSTGLCVDKLLDYSLSTTNADRTLKLNLYIQNQLRKSIMKIEGVEDAEV